MAHIKIFIDCLYSKFEPASEKKGTRRWRLHLATLVFINWLSMGQVHPSISKDQKYYNSEEYEVAFPYLVFLEENGPICCSSVQMTKN